MIRIIVSAIAMATIFLSQAQACLIQPRANEPLYQVVNDFFPNDEVRFASNWELLLTSILPDGSISLILNEDDPQWLPIGEELTLDAIYRQERPQFRRGHTDLRDSGSIVDLFENAIRCKGTLRCWCLMKTSALPFPKISRNYCSAIIVISWYLPSTRNSCRLLSWGPITSMAMTSG